jgi:hypothetical protein
MRSVQRAIAAAAKAGGRHGSGVAVAVLACCVALAPAALGATGSGGTGSPGSASAKPLVSATLEGCVTSAEQAERSATFAGEMSTIPGSAKMEMRIDVLERPPTEAAFHVVTAPGLGVWRVAAPGVKNYRYLKEVTNLAAPAFYRGAVRFRWLNAKGKVIKAFEMRTPRCTQPVVAPEASKPE